MAAAIDSTQVRQKEKAASTSVKPPPELKVFWADGVCSTDSDKQRKIVYIPQTYLNRRLIKLFRKLFCKMKNVVNLISYSSKIYLQALAKSIVDFVKIVSDKNTAIAEENAIGDHDAIKEEIKKLSLQLEQLTEKYDITEDEVTAYQSAVEKIQILDNKNLAISKEKNLINNIDSVVKIKVNPNLTNFNENVQHALSLVKEAADSAWLSQRTQIINKADRQLHDIYAERIKQSEIITRLQPKMEGNEQIHKMSSYLLEENKKLTQLVDVEQRINSLKTNYIQELGNLSNSFEKFSALYSSYVDFVNEQFVSSASDLEFSVNKIFRTELFSQKVAQIINNRTYSRFTPINLSNTISENDLMPENMSALIESLLSDSNTSLQLKNGYSLESGLRDILGNRYNVDYVVKMDGDSIQDMSPGKKALVLLRLLISLAESKSPILIDQPEDDIDNRSIFDELIHFIKERKIDWQIIAVTHNANIVLGGDAELVIIANQDGKNAPNEHYRFEYRSGAIENNTPVFDNDGTTSTPSD